MKQIIISLSILFLTGHTAIAQEKPSQVKVYPEEIFDVLNNPGIGFTTFQRFNGDTLNAVRWTEGRNIREWLPGDIVCDDKLYIPHDAPLGKYQLEIGIVTPASFEPRVQLAIEGKTGDGWYGLGEIEIRDN